MATGVDRPEAILVFLVFVASMASRRERSRQKHSIIFE